MEPHGEKMGLSATGAQVLAAVVGPVAFAADLYIRYALVQHACSTGHAYVLHLVSALALAITLAASLFCWRQYIRVRNAGDEGGSELERTHFVALAGVLLGLGCGLLIIANAVPGFLLNPCD